MGPASTNFGRPPLDRNLGLRQSCAVVSLRGNLLACLCCAVVVVGLVAERQARSGDITGRSMLVTRHDYALVGVQSGKCIGAPPDLPTAGAALEIATCDGSKRQQFKLEPRSARSYRLRNRATGMCLDVQGASTSAGAAVIQFPCNEGHNQRWAFTRLAPHVYEVTAVHSNQQLDVKEGGVKDGAQLEQWDTNHADNQRFRLISAPPRS